MQPSMREPWGEHVSFSADANFEFPRVATTIAAGWQKRDGVHALLDESSWQLARPLSSIATVRKTKARLAVKAIFVDIEFIRLPIV